MYFKYLQCPRTIVNIIQLEVTINIDLFIYFYLNLAKLLAGPGLLRLGMRKLFNSAGLSIFEPG